MTPPAIIYPEILTEESLLTVTDVFWAPYVRPVFRGHTISW